MMFIIHAAFALGLLSLSAGTALYIWSMNASEVKRGVALARIIGFIVICISTLSVIGTFYLGIKIWKEIYFLHIVQMHHAEQQQNELVTQPTSNSMHHHNNKK